MPQRRCYMNKCVYPARLTKNDLELQPMAQIAWIQILLIKTANT